MVVAQRPAPSPRAIMRACAARYGVEVGGIVGPSKQALVTRARHVAMALIRELVPGASYPSIGRMFGHRDHSTVMQACDRVHSGGALLAEFEALLVALRGGG